MKRVRCPKCDNFIYFDENQYTPGQTLVFDCPDCGKQFRIKLGKSKVQSTHKDEELTDENIKAPFGYITVIENVFGYKQMIPLIEGENEIGRRSKGYSINTPIETGDMSIDRTHCTIETSLDKNGEVVFRIWDNDSMTGTFIRSEELAPNEKRIVSSGEIVTIGATTFILQTKE